MRQGWVFQQEKRLPQASFRGDIDFELINVNTYSMRENKTMAHLDSAFDFWQYRKGTWDNTHQGDDKVPSPVHAWLVGRSGWVQVTDSLLCSLVDSLSKWISYKLVGNCSPYEKTSGVPRMNEVFEEAKLRQYSRSTSEPLIENHHRDSITRQHSHAKASEQPWICSWMSCFRFRARWGASEPEVVSYVITYNLRLKMTTTLPKIIPHLHRRPYQRRLSESNTGSFSFSDWELRFGGWTLSLVHRRNLIVVRRRLGNFQICFWITRLVWAT